MKRDSKNVRERLKANDVGLEGLAAHTVGDADAHAFQYVGVFQQDLVHFAGIDVVTAHDDHVLLAVHDEEIAFLVHDGQVAGIGRPLISYFR